VGGLKKKEKKKWKLVFVTLKCLILLLNALKLHLKVIKFSKPEKEIPKKWGDIPPCHIHPGGKSPHYEILVTVFQ
jgi:hypothetical protein